MVSSTMSRMVVGKSRMNRLATRFIPVGKDVACGCIACKDDRRSTPGPFYRSTPIAYDTFSSSRDGAGFAIDDGFQCQQFFCHCSSNPKSLFGL